MKNQQNRMELYCIKCSKFTSSNNIKAKREIDGKNNICYCCIVCSFKKFETIDEEELSDLLKILNYISNNVSV